MVKKKKNRAFKYLKRILIILISIIIIFSIYLFSNPKQRIRNTDFETSIIYLKLFDKFMSSANKNKLFRSLIDDNNDVRSLGFVSHYALINSKCELIKMLDEKCNHLKSLKKDSVWTVEISPRYYKESSTEMVYMVNGICEHVDKLKKKCTNK